MKETQQNSKLKVEIRKVEMEVRKLKVEMALLSRVSANCAATGIVALLGKPLQRSL